MDGIKVMKTYKIVSGCGVFKLGVCVYNASFFLFFSMQVSRPPPRVSVSISLCEA
jgi:hypothetical protein